MSDVQCPNCGGYKVSTTKDEVLTRQVERKVPIQFTWGKWFRYMLYTSVAAGVFLLLLAFALFNSSGVHNSIATLLIVGVPLALWWIFNLLYVPVAMRDTANGKSVKRTETVTIGHIYHYYCTICGKEWAWQTGTAKPSVTVRPDLIAKARTATWFCTTCGQPNNGERVFCLSCGAHHPDWS